MSYCGNPVLRYIVINKLGNMTIMKRILFLNMAICLIALGGFSQNAESTNLGLRINRNAEGAVRGGNDNIQT